MLLPTLARADAQRVVTLDEAVRTALVAQPSLRQAHATTQVKDAQADEARAPLLPQVALSLSRVWTTNNFTPGSVSGVGGASGLGVSGPSGHLINRYSPEAIQAQQLIWDFNQTLGKYRAAREAKASQEETERATRLQVVLTARTAFFQARAAKDLVRVAQDTLANQDLHLKQTKGFVEVGTQPEIALATAQTNRANALVQEITAENNYDAAKATLNQAMGVEQTTGYDVSDETLPTVEKEDEGTDLLLREALTARPEFAAIEHQVAQQRYVRQSAFGGFFPSIGAQTTFQDNGTRLDNLVWNWNASLTLNWTLFQGLLTPAQLREQDADIAALEAQRDGLKLQVRLQVEQARLAVRAAKTALSAAIDAQTNADQQLRLAEGRYQTGVGNIIELSDAQVARTNAAAQRVTAEYNVSTARAQLVQALGRL